MSKLFCSPTAMKNVAKQIPDTPENHGRIWTVLAMQQLRDDYINGCLLHELCVKQGRTVDSVIAKLSAQQLIEYDPCTGNYYRSSTIPIVEPKNETPQAKPNEKEETIMSNETTPIQNLTLIFGKDIKSCSEANLINVITKCQDEIRSFNTIPRNKWTEKRAVELKAAIDAAVAELDTRVEE